MYDKCNTEGGLRMSIIGIDCGSHRVKVYTPHSQIIFDRYIMTAKPRPLDSLNSQDKWRVSIDGVDYFIGQLAEMEGASMAFEKNKSGHKDTLPLVFTAIGLANIQQPIIKASVVTGLPLVDLHHQKDSFRKLLLGEHVVRINNAIKQWIEIEDVIVFGEGAGAIWNTVLSLDGNVRRQFGTWERVIDIGYRTVDFCTLKNMHYVADQSTSIPLGIYHAQMDTYKRIGGMVDTFPEHVVPDAQALQELAEKIESNINKLWLNRSNIQLAGGGAYLLSEYLPYPIMADAEWANATGYYKVGVVKWLKTKG